MKLLAIVAAVAALFATGANAADLSEAAPTSSTPAPTFNHTLSGYLSLYAGWASWNQNDLSLHGSFGVLGGDARLNTWLHPNLSMQADIEGEATTNGFASCCSSTDHRIAGDGGLHLSWRDPNKGLVGVFGGVFGSSEFWYSNIDPGGSVWQGFGGVEGQYYLGKATLYGQAGWTGVIGNTSYGINEWFLRAVGRYFLTPDDKFQAEFGYGDGTYSGAADGDISRTLNWGALYEHKFANVPISGFGEYAGFSNSNETNHYTSSTEHQFMVGLRFMIDQPTLLAQDREGATLDMPKIVRPLAWSNYNF